MKSALILTLYQTAGEAYLPELDRVINYLLKIKQQRPEIKINISYHPELRSLLTITDLNSAVVGDFILDHYLTKHGISLDDKLLGKVYFENKSFYIKLRECGAWEITEILSFARTGNYAI